jgi:hypothetical protein
VELNVFKWPWVSREVLTAKDELIAHLREEISLLRANPVPMNVHVDLPEGMVLTQPAVMRRRRPDQQEKPAEQPIDYANIDENDPLQMAVLATRELGPTPNKYVLNQFLRQARVQIAAAREAKQRPVEPAQVVAPKEMPDAIRQMIQMADSGNASALAELTTKG